MRILSKWRAIMSTQLWASLCFAAALGLTGCGGSGGTPGGTDDGGTDGGADDGGEFFTAAELDTDWQLLYGAETGGIGSDKEGLRGLQTDASGNVYALTDRRFGTNGNGSQVLLASLDATGSPTSINALTFSSRVSPLDFRRDSAGNFIMAIDELEVIKTDASGVQIWAKTLQRDPFAFGGFESAQIELDAADNVYIAGTFNPSEGNDDHAFVLKLDANGNGVWLRSWIHDPTFEHVRLAVTGSGNVFVSDRLDGDFGAVRRLVILGFATDGAAIGQVEMPASRALPLTRAAPIANGNGFAVVTTHQVTRDGSSDFFVGHFSFDASMALTAIKGTQMALASDEAFFTHIHLTKTSTGALRFAVETDGKYTLWEYGASSAIAGAYRLTRSEDGQSPVIDDDDYQLRLAAGVGDTWIAAGTSEVPGSVTLVPRTTESLTITGTPSNPGLTVFSDTLVVTNGATPYSVAPDASGQVNDFDPAEEDALFFSASLR